MNGLIWVLLIVGGFFAGSIMFCELIPKLLTHKDICGISDDGNPGAFNVFRHCGKTVGTFCLLLDILKGFIPVFLASMFMKTDGLLFTLVMVAPVLGHASGLFNRFNGGKCISTSFGVMLGILPVTWIGLTILATLYIFFSVAVKFNSNKIRSIVVYTLFGVSANATLAVIGLPSVAAGCLLIAVIAVVKHLKIKKLINESVKEDE